MPLALLKEILLYAIVLLDDSVTNMACVLFVILLPVIVFLDDCQR